MKKGGAFVCAALTLLLISVLFPALADAPLVINEVCSANGKAVKDSDGESPDWIELYNPTGETVDLNGYCLSDDADEPNKFVFPKTTIAPYGYAIVFASRKLNMSPEMHADFRLSSAGGESVYLFAPSGEMIDTATLPPLEKDISYGRLYDGGAEWGSITPTPKQTNNTSRAVDDAVFVAPPVFSHESGFYGEDILLSLSAPEGTTVYYSLDGATPTTESTIYTAPLALGDASENANVYAVMDNMTARSYYKPSSPVDKCHVVRAVAVDGEGHVSNVVTKSFFVGFDGRESCDGIAVVSLVTDPKNLFDDQAGIYTTGAVHDEWLAGDEYDTTVDAYWQPANYQQRGREWEREAEFTYFGVGGEYTFTQTVGIRVHGRISRASSQKSFNLYARDEYGRDTFAFPIFAGERTTSSLILRTGGNDAALTKLRDAFAQSLISERAVDTQATVPCALFLDGEYWGLYFLEQRYDDDYIEEQYGIDQNHVVIAEYGELKEGVQGDFALYEDVVAFAKKNDLSQDGNYQAIARMIDLDSLIDYFASEIYLANSDWPWNNYTVWRSRETSDRAYEDGRWRYLVNDLDQTMGYDATLSGYTRDSFALAVQNPIFEALLANASFREQFALTFMDLCNTSFAPARTIAMLDDMQALLTNATVADYHRVRGATRGVEYYEKSVSAIREFLEKRGEYIIGYMMERFSLSAMPAALTLNASDPAMGGVAINTVSPDMTNGWTGRYFVDYPVTLTAVPKAGYRFLRWEITGGSLMGEATDERVRIRLSAAGTQATAVFEPIAQSEARETLAAFSCAKAGAAIKGNSMQGYAATGGVLGADARLNASVDGKQGRKIEWSDLEYEGGGFMPVIRANGKNRWSESAYIDLSLSTLGYGDLRFSLRLGADERGARAFTLSYSVDGRRYTKIKGAEVVISRSERMTEAYLEFALPEALKNRENLHIRLCVNGNETVRGRAKLTGLTEGEVAFNDLRVTGVKIPVDTTNYQYAADALKGLSGLPEPERKAADALLDGFSTENQSQREIDAQTEAIRAFAAALPFSRAAASDALALLPEQAGENAATVYLPEGLERLVYPVMIDLTAYETAYIYRFADGAFTLALTLSVEGGNAARVAFPQQDSGLYLIFDKPLSVYCAAYTVEPAPASNTFSDDGLSDCLVTAGARLAVCSLGVGYDGTVEIDLAGLGFRGYVWAYRADNPDFSRPVFSTPVRDGVLRAEGVAEGEYLLLSHNAKGILRSIERARTLRANIEKAPAGNEWLPWAGVAGAACALALIGVCFAQKKRKK